MRLRLLQEHTLLPCGTASVSHLQTHGGTGQHGRGQRGGTGTKREGHRDRGTERGIERVMAAGVHPLYP